MHEEHADEKNKRSLHGTQTIEYLQLALSEQEDKLKVYLKALILD